jgi:signal transduction histidine kinase
MEHRQPAVVNDVSADDRIPQVCREAPISSAVVVPIQSAQPTQSAQPIAALGAYWSQPHQADSTQVRLLLDLADSAAVAMENIHARQALEQRASQEADELAALTYAVSHDLRAPIRHLEGFARILQDVEIDGPQIRHAAQRIEDAAGHLRDMVDGLLALSRIGRSEVHSQAVDLADLGRAVAAALAAGPPQDGTERVGPVEFVAPDHLPTTGDARLLQTVMQNLLGNAWKFTSRVPRPRVELGARPLDPESGTSEYFVRDNGAGFEQGSAGRLFSAFQRLHSPEDFPGTGMGLAAVKRIVSKHGGAVRATAVTDEGATFYFTLPGE